jgi:hypothetical protein
VARWVCEKIAQNEGPPIFLSKILHNFYGWKKSRKNPIDILSCLKICSPLVSGKSSIHMFHWLYVQSLQKTYANHSFPNTKGAKSKNRSLWRRAAYAIDCFHDITQGDVTLGNNVTEERAVGRVATGLPDFSRQNRPKYGKIYQNCN